MSCNNREGGREGERGERLSERKGTYRYLQRPEESIGSPEAADEAANHVIGAGTDLGSSRGAAPALTIRSPL